MLPPSQAIQSSLSVLRGLCQRSNPDPRELQGIFLTMQQVFQRQVLPLGGEDASGNTALQPLLTEMNRTLRLMAMDIAFLQTARQPTTQQQRQRQMLTKIDQLEAFVATLQQTLEH
ncbi:MAG: heterocyst frequency control protein PatD [Spirulina sp.]